MLLSFSLFGISFLAATILPFSSEVALFSAIKGGMDKNTALFVASCGNVLAIVFNYYLGYFLYKKTKKRLFKTKMGKKSFAFGKKYIKSGLLLSWLPIIGDPLTLVAGLLRVNFILFFIIAGSLRVARYYLLVRGI